MPEMPAELPEDAFAAGEQVVDTEAWLTCPCCAAGFELLLDPSGGPAQEYIEDCEVCCRPLYVAVTWDIDGAAHVEARPEDA